MAYSNTHTVPITGILLSGGKSKRMGRDKALIDFQGVPHRDFLFQEMQESTCDSVMVSCSKKQEKELSHYPLLTDEYSDIGPMSALLSAFKKEPNHAYLILAIDLPNVRKETLDFLIKNRDPTKYATSYFNEKTGFLEPLLAIYEPKSYAVFQDYLEKKTYSPSQLLRDYPVHSVKPPKIDCLININTPEELRFFNEKKDT